MPSVSAIHGWKKRVPEFAEALTLAKEMAADTAADELLTVARGTTPATASADRVRIAALQWSAAKAAPHRYGAKAEAAEPPSRRLVIRVRHFEEVVGPDGRPEIREIPPRDAN